MSLAGSFMSRDKSSPLAKRWFQSSSSLFVVLDQFRTGLPGNVEMKYVSLKFLASLSSEIHYDHHFCNLICQKNQNIYLKFRRTKGKSNCLKINFTLKLEIRSFDTIYRGKMNRKSAPYQRQYFFLLLDAYSI